MNISDSDRAQGASPEAPAQMPGKTEDIAAGEYLSVNTTLAGIVKVLLVGENAGARRSASHCLNAAGFSVAVASDGFEALASVVQRCPDVVLADVTMPRLDGYQMCALIKSNSDYRHIPVIMITGGSGLLDEERARLVGSDAHVTRPFSVRGLTEAVRAALIGRHAIDQSGPRQASPANDDSSGQHTV